MAEKPKVRRKATAAAADKSPKAALPPPAAGAPAAPPEATPKAVPKVTPEAKPEARPEAAPPAPTEAAAPAPAAPPGWKAEAIPTPGGAVSVVTLVSGPERSGGPGGSTHARAAGSGDGAVAGFDPRRDTLALVGTAEARVEPIRDDEVAVRLPDGATVTLRLRG